MTRVVVVGNGMVGSRFVQDLLQRDLDRRLEITVVGDEPGDAYNRMQLSNLLAGRADRPGLTLASDRWYASQGVQVVHREAVRLERVRRLVRLDDATALPYDVVVLATGSEIVVPPAPGLIEAAATLVAGAIGFRTLADCAEIEARAARARAAVVLGAGVLGLEAARALAGRGLPVRLLQRGARLMDRQLDGEASATLTRTAATLGIDVVSGTVRRIVGNPVRQVELDDGRSLPADLLLVCCGVRPRTALASEAGLTVRDGVVVDDELRSVDDPTVFAIGECAEHRGQLYGLVAPGWEQARVAADVLTATPNRYAGSPVLVRLKADGIELVSLGRPESAEDEVVRFSDSGRGVYQKLVVSAGRLVGATLLGDTRTVGTITQLFDRGTAVPADRASLLLARRSATPAVTSPTTLPARATICHCNGVTKAAICAAWTDGARSCAEVVTRTRATTGCGTCRDAVDGIVDWLAAADAGTSDPIEQPVAPEIVRI